MRIAIEIVLSITFIAVGYITTCLLLNNKKITELSLDIIAIKSKSRVLYLLVTICAVAALICVFNIIYFNDTLLHQIKLITLVTFMAPMAAIDYKTQRIPNVLLIALLITRAIFYVIEFIILPNEFMSILLNGLIGGGIIFIFFFLLLLVFKNSIGMGDIKLFFVMGLYQGLWGVINSVFFSLMVSFIVSVCLLITKKKKKSDVIPFGPSIFTGTVLAICLSGM